MWQHKAVPVKPGESVMEVLEREGKDDWEPWHVEVLEVSCINYTTIFFKRRNGYDR